MILGATDPCKIHVFLGFLDTKQISNWRWLSSYYIPNCISYIESHQHLIIWSIYQFESQGKLEFPHAIGICSVNCEILYNHQLWLQLGTTVCLLVLIWIYELNYNASQLGINFSKKSQKKQNTPSLLLGFLRCGHPYACLLFSRNIHIDIVTITMRKK